jgi:hypothetical protein
MSKVSAGLEENPFRKGSALMRRSNWREIALGRKTMNCRKNAGAQLMLGQLGIRNKLGM